MKVVFLYPPSQYLNHSMFKHFTYFAETIEIISRYINDIEILDCAVEMKSRDEIYASFRNADYLISLVEPYNIFVANELFSICKDVNEKCRIIVYGTAPVLFPNYFFKNIFIDNVISNGNFAEGILNVIIGKNNNKMIKPLLEKGKHIWGNSLDSRAPLDLYKRWGDGMYEFTVQVGCPYNCSFCSEKILFGEKKGLYFEHRPIEDMIKILSRVKSVYNSVYFSATTFTYDKEWVYELCEEMVNNNCVIPWRSDTRIDCIDEKLLISMKAAGVKQLSIGIESLSDDLLKQVNKGQKRDSIIETVNLCKEKGVNVKALLILGIPGQTADDVYDTQGLIEKMGIPYRWKEYSPIRELHEEDVLGMDISSKIGCFSRHTYNAKSIEGLSPEEYMSLLFPRGYKR